MLSYTVSTAIQASVSYVKQEFTEDLLLRLSPPFPKVRIKRFDGCKANDQVELEIDLLFKKLTWSSLITEDQTSPEEWFFIDQGVKMPFGLRFWQHKHRVKKIAENTCEVIDEISFDTNNPFLNYLLLPFFWGMIFYRKPFYKKYLSISNAI